MEHVNFKKASALKTVKLVLLAEHLYSANLIVDKKNIFNRTLFEF